MASADPSAPYDDDDGTTTTIMDDDAPRREESRAANRPIKKICIIAFSLIPAIALLSISNVILAHVFMAAKVFVFPHCSERQTNKAQAAKIAGSGAPLSPKPNNKKKKKKKNIPQQRQRPEPTVVTKTIYVPPTQGDLIRIKKELETSDPLPPIDDDDSQQRSAARNVRSAIGETDALLSRRDEEFAAAEKEMEELAEAFDSFLRRFEADIISSSPRGGGGGGGGGMPGANNNDASAEYLRGHMPSLTSVLGRRASFMDLNRRQLGRLFALAREDVRWLLGAKNDPTASEERAALFLNAGDSLMDALGGDDDEEAPESSCRASYFALGEGEPSEEFAPPPPERASKRPAKRAAAKPERAAPIVIADETARESDLYDLVETIKTALSRRDLSSSPRHYSEDDEGIMPSPMSEEGANVVRSRISPMAKAIQQKWGTALGREAQTREYWVGKMHELESGGGGGATDDGGGGDEGGMCASPNLVEGMVKGGLETLRQKGRLRSFLEGFAVSPAEDDPERARALANAMTEAKVPEMDYDRDEQRASSPPGRSSWKAGKRSLSYAVDGPLLHRGVAGWIDWFVDAISGYNDNLDMLLDWAVGDEGLSVGTSAVDGFSRMVRKIPFPKEEHVERWKGSGILAGRARVVLEE